MRLGFLASLTLLAAAGAVAAPLSKQAALRLMHERHEGMETIGKTNKVLRREVAAENVAGIRAGARTMASLSGKASTWFAKGTGPEIGHTGAKPEIWQKPADFSARLRDFQTASKALHQAAAKGEIAAIKASYANLGKTCKACHDSYRADMHH